ncbi:MAG TPA: hypothetical protein VFA78_04605 [Chloroflexota bacterium]|nr:hypothetical protein [Chloroflexota bacterium]
MRGGDELLTVSGLKCECIGQPGYGVRPGSATAALDGADRFGTETGAFGQRFLGERGTKAMTA